MALTSVTAVSVGQVYVGMNSNTGTRFAPAFNSTAAADPQKSYASLYWTNSNTDAHTVVVTVTKDLLSYNSDSVVITLSQNVYKLNQGATGFIVPLHITSATTISYTGSSTAQYGKRRYLVSVGVFGATAPAATVTTVVYQPFILTEANLSNYFTAAGINAAVVSVQKSFQIGFSQATDRSVVVSAPFLQVSSYPTMPGIILCTDAVEKVDPGEVENFYRVRLLDAQNNEIYDAHHPPSINGGAFTVTIPSTTVVSTGNHTAIVEIATCTGGFIVGADYTTNQFILQKMYSSAQTILTAGVTVTSASTNMHSWLDNSYWYLTDLQVNLGTRAVNSRLGTIELRPSDTINFAILFNDGSVGVDPQATDIKLAVRTTSNASAYHIWSSTTVSTVTVSGDVYYAITVTASEDDLLTAQANNLLAGSNAAQSLLGEIQWTTTRGTFSSDTFTINVPSEVVREPDV